MSWDSRSSLQFKFTFNVRKKKGIRKADKTEPTPPPQVTLILDQDRMLCIEVTLLNYIGSIKM